MGFKITIPICSDTFEIILMGILVLMLIGIAIGGGIYLMFGDTWYLGIPVFLLGVAMIPFFLMIIEKDYILDKFPMRFKC